MAPEEQLILKPAMRPMKTQRMRWYDDPRFTALRKPPPTIPPLGVRVGLDDGKTQILSQRPK